MNSFYSIEELQNIGFQKLGKDVNISRKVSIYSAEHICIHDHVRIDDFVVLSGCIEIGSYVHIATLTVIFGGKAGVYIKDFANISSRVALYAISDDYSGEYMTNPMIAETYKNTQHEPVFIEKHVIIATGSTVLPGVRLGEGCAVGAMSLVKQNVQSWTMVGGIPAHYLKERKRKILELEKDFLQQENGQSM